MQGGGGIKTMVKLTNPPEVENAVAAKMVTFWEQLPELGESDLFLNIINEDPDTYIMEFAKMKKETTIAELDSVLKKILAKLKLLPMYKVSVKKAMKMYK